MRYRTPAPRQRRRSNFPVALLTILGVAALVIALCVGIAVVQNNTKTVQTCTVTSKNMTTQMTSKNQSQTVYQVETEQCGVMRVQDNMFQGIWNSADIFASLQEGKTYTITTIGWRIPWASQFPTIVKVGTK